MTKEEIKCRQMPKNFDVLYFIKKKEFIKYLIKIQKLLINIQYCSIKSIKINK